MNELFYFGLTMASYLILSAAALTGTEALLVFVSIITMIGNIIVGKIVTLFGFQVNPSAGLAVCIYWAGILLNQYGGMRAAKRALWYNITALVLLTAVGWLTLHLDGGIVPEMDSGMTTLFEFMPGVMLGGITSFTLSYLFTIFVQRKLRQIKGGTKEGADLSVGAQAIIVAIANLIDITVFATIAYWGMKMHLPQVILMTWATRLVMLVFGLPFIFMIRRLYRTGLFPLIR